LSRTSTTCARDGTAIGIAGQMVDVTERVRIEAQLVQAQSAVGQGTTFTIRLPRCRDNVG
jgi:TolB-like protein